MRTSPSFPAFFTYIFHGPTLGHVSGHLGTCHVADHKMKKKGLGKLICLGTKILKIGPNLKEIVAILLLIVVTRALTTRPK